MKGETGIWSPERPLRGMLHLNRKTVNLLNKVQTSLLVRSFFCHYFSKPTKIDKECCISRLGNCKSMADLKHIQAQIFRGGLHQSTDTLKKLMVFCTDPSNGNLVYAERVFNYIQNPCLFIYNVIIKAFAKKCHFHKCLMLFNRLREAGLWPDNFTYPFVLKAIGCLGEVLEGEKVHGLVFKTGFEYDSYVCNSLMDMYAQLGNLDVVKKLFDEMPERDVVSWNVLISGFVKCRRFEDAIDVFCCMRQQTNLMPSEATVVSTLSACTALKHLEIGKEIHRYIRDNLELTFIIGTALLDMYSKCGCLSIAREIFAEMPLKNVICWTSMVSGYVNCGKLDEARELFERSPVRDVVLWTTMINGYVQFNRFDEAVALFQEMQIRRVKPDKFIVVALLTGCAQIGSLELGTWIHGYINENRIPIDAVVGTSLIEMYSKCGCLGKALEIFYGLREKDTATWTSIICGLAMNGKTSKALELFSNMKQVGARPDEVTFIGVLSACSHGGLVEKGREFFNSMTSVYNIEPKSEHFGCLIDLLGRAGQLDEAEELIKKMPNANNEILVPIYGSLLSACRIYKNVEMGERVAEWLVKIESTDSSLHILLTNIYASAGRWEDVNRVRQKMVDLGVRKVPGCSSIDVDGVIHEFFAGDQSHVEIGEIHSVLDRMAKSLFTSEENEMGREETVFEEQGLEAWKAVDYTWELSVSR